MDEQFAFWLPTRTVDQLTFTGQIVRVETFCEGHILHSGVLMCRESREKILNTLGTKTFKTVKSRPAGVKVCKNCQYMYQKNRDSAWSAWAEGRAKKVVGTLPPVIKA